jgi:hypothetical protein
MLHNIQAANAYQLSDLDSLDPDEFGNEDTTFDVGRPENGSQTWLLSLRVEGNGVTMFK